MSEAEMHDGNEKRKCQNQMLNEFKHHCNNLPVSRHAIYTAKIGETYTNYNLSFRLPSAATNPKDSGSSAIISPLALSFYC